MCVTQLMLLQNLHTVLSVGLDHFQSPDMCIETVEIQSFESNTIDTKRLH